MGVDEKFFLGGDSPSLTGNQALDGGIVGLGLGALGAAVLGPTIQGALNGGQQNQSFNNQNNRGCQCDYSLTFRDQNGNTHAACQRRDNTGRTWCYTTGWSNNCGDLQSSKRYPNNP